MTVHVCLIARGVCIVSSTTKKYNHLLTVMCCFKCFDITKKVLLKVRIRLIVCFNADTIHANHEINKHASEYNNKSLVFVLMSKQAHRSSESVQFTRSQPQSHQL